MSRLEPCVKFPIEEKILKDLVTKATDWSLMNGAAMRSKIGPYDPYIVQHAPFALFPSTFPRKEFEKSLKLQTAINELVHLIAHDHEFLRETLKNTILVDDFTRKLYEIYEKMREQGGPIQNISLGLLRADYMLNASVESAKVKQVEINTVAVSLAGVSSRVSLLHRYALSEINRRDLLPHLPENKALSGLCNGMIRAWELYGVPQAAILFIVEDITYNICDQRAHEFHIRAVSPQISVLRRTLTEIYHSAQTNEDNRLFIDGYEIAVVYFRAGYHPDHYHGPEEWEARERIEFTKAIKCPTISYHLAGTKKVQQALASPRVLERFFPNDVNKVEQVRSLFTGIYSLDVNTKEGEDAVRRALQDPKKFVMKPQREGGGNNIYGDKIHDFLLELGESQERNGWILQERIFPPLQKSYLIRPGKSEGELLYDTVSELGIFGVIIGDENKILVNEQTGHMLRTKLSTSDEGGVAAGIGFLDSPFLDSL